MVSGTEKPVRLRDITLTLGKHEHEVRICLYDSLARAILGKDTPPLKVLDIGCGRGELMRLAKAKGCTATGIDLEAECVEASAYHGDAFQGGFSNVLELFRPGDFDVVVSSHVLEHVDSPTEALNACKSLAAKRYVFAVPNVHRCSRLLRVLLGSSKPDHPTHVFGWGGPEFAAILNRNGFEIIQWYSDRVTINPFGGSIGAVCSKILRPIETRLLPYLTPWLSSSLIAECRLVDSPHSF